MVDFSFLFLLLTRCSHKKITVRFTPSGYVDVISSVSLSVRDVGCSAGDVSLCVWVFGDVPLLFRKFAFVTAYGRTLPTERQLYAKPNARGCEKGAFWPTVVLFCMPVAAENRVFASSSTGDAR